MTTQFRTKSSRVAAIAIFALLLATTACGTTKGAALTPAAVVDPQQAADRSATFAGDTYLSADGQYGVGSRTGGATAQTNDAHVCTTSGSTCLEP